MRRLITPQKVVEGLGAAHAGLSHWWWQRLTAVVNLLLVVWFAVSMAALAGADYRTIVWWMKDPLVTILLGLLVASVFYHAKLGLQVIIEDYVHDGAWKLIALFLNGFFNLILGMLGIVLILKVSLGG